MRTRERREKSEREDGDHTCDNSQRLRNPGARREPPYDGLDRWAQTKSSDIGEMKL